MDASGHASSTACAAVHHADPAIVAMRAAPCSPKPIAPAPAVDADHTFDRKHTKEVKARTRAAIASRMKAEARLYAARQRVTEERAALKADLGGHAHTASSCGAAACADPLTTEAERALADLHAAAEGVARAMNDYPVRRDLAELRAFMHPPDRVMVVLRALLHMLAGTRGCCVGESIRISTLGRSVRQDLQAIRRRILNNPRSLHAALEGFVQAINEGRVPSRNWGPLGVGQFTNDPSFCVDHVRMASRGAAQLCAIVLAMQRYHTVWVAVQPVVEEAKAGALRHKGRGLEEAKQHVKRLRAEAKAAATSAQSLIEEAERLDRQAAAAT